MNHALTLPNDVLMEIKYQKNGQVEDVTCNAMLPVREHDFVELLELTKMHNDLPFRAIKFWFEEGRVVSERRYYADDLDEATLKEYIKPGVCAICPISGHLMYIYTDDNTWTLAGKGAHEAYMHWLCDQHFIGTDEEAIK